MIESVGVGVGLVLLFSGNAYAEGPAAVKAGQVIPMGLVLLALAWGAVKSFRISKRKTTNTKCALSLGITLIGFFILFSSGFSKPYLNDHDALIGIAVLFAGGLLIVSMVLAILGLAEYKQKFSQGKKQAIWAIALNSVFILLFLTGVIVGVSRHVNAKKEIVVSNEAPIIQPDFNFRLLTPGKPYAKIKPETINPFAKVAYLRSNPQVYYMLIPERIGIDRGLDTEGLLDISQAGLKGTAQSVSIAHPTHKTINGMDGLYSVVDTQIKGKNITYVYWACSINGFCYQQIVFSESKHKAVLLQNAEKIFAGFSQIDPDEVCYSDDVQPFGFYESGQFGYSMDLRDTNWLKWEDVKKSFPGADIAGKTGNNAAAFFISTLPLEALKPDHGTIIDAFLQSLSVEKNSDKLRLSSSQKYIDFHEYVYKYEAAGDDESLLDYTIKISIGPDRAFLTSVWTDKTVSESDDFFEQIDASIRYLPFRAHNESQRFDAHGNLAVADIHNRIGIVLEVQKNYEQAGVYYTSAVFHDPRDEIFWDNAMKVLNQQKKHREAVQLLEKYDGTIPFAQGTQSWYAWHLAQSGDKQAALKRYRHLFSKLHNNEEDFKYYITLLAELNKLDDIDPAYDAYLNQQDNQQLRLHQAQTWHKLADYNKALDVLKQLDEKAPQVVLEKIYNFQELERHKSALALCERLIGNEKYAGDGYFFKGKSEYHLKWYAKAKLSFENALARYPGNETIELYLKELSGILGQGDNSLVKREIQPVPLPEQVVKQMNTPLDQGYVEGYGAYFLQYCFGYEWRADGMLKNTIRHKIYIENATGANAFSTYSMTFNPFYEQIYVNSLVVRNKAGDVIATGDENTYFIMDDQSSSLKTHRKILNVPVPQLVPGAILEITATKILGNHDRFPFTERLLAARYPVLNSMVYVMGDPETYDLKVENRVQRRAFNSGEMAYIHTPMIFLREPKQPHYQKSLPCVYINGNGQNWALQGENYLKKIQKQLISTADIKQLSLSLVGKDDSERIKISKIYDYLQNHYKYLGLEFGSRGEIPYEASVTVNNKYGDCKDHAILFHHMLKSLGIDNYLALVNSDGLLQKDMPSRDQFDHIINFVPGNGGLFLDSTDKESDFNLGVPTYLGGVDALVLEPGNVRFITIPEYQAAQTRMKVDRTFRIEDDRLQVNEKLRMTGHYAAFMRNFLKHRNREEQLSWVQATIQSLYPSAKLEKMAVQNLLENDKSVILDCFYIVSDRIHALENEMVVNLTGIWEPYYLLPESVKKRKTDFEIKIPFLFESRNEMILPQGFSINGSSKASHNSQTDFGRFSMTPVTGKDKIGYTLDLETRKGVFSKDQYQGYSQFYQEVLKAACQDISLIRTDHHVSYGQVN